MSYPRRGPAAWAIHPGVILKKEFLEPLKLSVYALAKELGVAPQGINDVALGKRSITPATAILLARFFQTSEEFWLNLQGGYDLAMVGKKLRRKASRIKPHHAAA